MPLCLVCGLPLSLMSHQRRFCTRCEHGRPAKVDAHLPTPCHCQICGAETLHNVVWYATCQVWYRDIAWRFDQLCAVLWPRKNETRATLNHYLPAVPARPKNLSLQNAADALLVDWLLSDDCRGWIASHAGGWKRG